MPIPCFISLLHILQKSLSRNNTMARKSSRGFISPDVRLAITLRLLAGGSYFDVMITFRVGRSTCFFVFRDTLQSIDNLLRLPGLPFENHQAKCQLEEGFRFSRANESPLRGCVAAVDGIVVKIRKPSDIYGLAKFFNRKGLYSIPVQAVVDSNYKFLAVSARCSGSTHDSTAFGLTRLGQKLADGDLPVGFLVAGDEAYPCSEGLLTPWPGSSQALSTDRDCFNFFLSSHRVHVEQALGQLTERWRVLLSPLRFSLPQCTKLIVVVAKLQNFCKDNNDPLPQNSERVTNRNAHLLKTVRSLHESAGSGRRRHLESCGLRLLLTNCLASQKLTRPV